MPHVVGQIVAIAAPARHPRRGPHELRAFEAIVHLAPRSCVHGVGTAVALETPMFSDDDRAADGSWVLVLLTELSKHRRQSQRPEGSTRNGDESGASPEDRQVGR